VSKIRLRVVDDIARAGRDGIQTMAEASEEMEALAARGNRESQSQSVGIMGLMKRGVMRRRNP